MKISKIKLLFVIISVLSLNCYGQDYEDIFLRGYYVNNNGEKVEGFIKYKQGTNSRLVYKKTLDSRNKKLDKSEVKEFFIGSNIHFIKCTQDIKVRVQLWNISMESDFIRIFEDGKISLYIHYIKFTNPQPTPYPVIIETILIKKQGSEVLEPLSDNRDKKRRKLEELFPGEPNVVEGLSQDNWEDVLSFVRAYNKAKV
ncbi:MAG: hypothetical protein IPK31_03930 [Chitinophagaceae bacterium]|nr:hypothetical protein [Chitinophagaceae bacterium]